MRLVTQARQFMREADRVFDAVSRYELPPSRLSDADSDDGGWLVLRSVGPVPADPTAVEALAEVDRALVGVRADAERAATLIPGLESHVKCVLAACTDVRRSCVRIDDDGRPDISYSEDLRKLTVTLDEFMDVGAALRCGA